MDTGTQPDGRAAPWPEIRSEVPCDFRSEECSRLSALIRRLCFAEDSPSMHLRADVSRAGYREAWLWSSASLGLRAGHAGERRTVADIPVRCH